MKAGDANGVPVQMKWVNASDVWKPATTMSQRGAEAQAPWTRTIVGLSELLARAVAGRIDTISTAAITITSLSSRGLTEPRAALLVSRANEAFIQEPSRA